MDRAKLKQSPGFTFQEGLRVGREKIEQKGRTPEHRLVTVGASTKALQEEENYRDSEKK